jgi:TolB protein
MTRTVLCLAGAAALTSLTLLAESSQQPQQPPAAPQQQSEVRMVINGTPGTPPKVAVAPFIALSNDAETTAAAKTVGDVLSDDLAYEREFYMIGKDVLASIRKAPSIDQIPVDAYKEVGANALVVGTVRKTGSGVAVQVRVIDVQTGRTAFGKEYSGSVANPRAYAHTAADEIFKQWIGLNGVARTKLTFSSDRDGERMKGPAGDREIKEVYISDYDGANQRRVTATHTLNITPVWAPDGKSIAYTSYRRGYQDIFVSYIYEGRLETPANGNWNKQNYLPIFSPDGTKIAFTSTRDGNPEIYVMNRDGSGVHRLTDNPAIDVTPTWSPSGNQIAWTSDRTGNPQV